MQELLRLIDSGSRQVHNIALQMDRCRRHAHLFGDLTNRGAFLAERQDPRMAQHEPWTAADTAPLARFRQAGMNALADANALLLAIVAKIDSTASLKMPQESGYCSVND